MTRYNLQNLYLAKIKNRYLLNKPGSIKCTFKIVIDIKGANMIFVPGDCLGVMAENDPEIVKLSIKYMKGDKSDKIINTRANKTFFLAEYLTKKANITRIKPALLKFLLKKAEPGKKKSKLSSILKDKKKLKNYIDSHQLWDTLKEFYSKNISPQEICSALLPMLPRLYSISSAQNVYPNEVHLTVAYMQYETSNITRFGVASHYLCVLADKDVKIYVHPSHKFFLPKDPNTPIIMIGTGTGIAPFMSFIQERYYQKANGKNWLFFGECNKDNDFYYEDYLTNLEKENFLDITSAFSRDQKEKIYVQHRLLEQKDKIWQWIKNGAVIYVCGDAKKMAKDVEKTLLTIFKDAGSMSETQANDYLQVLSSEKYYLKDVY